MEKRNTPLLKIAVVGPESSGKSTLCKQLSEHFDGSYVPEFARTYLEKHSSYNQDDLNYFVQKQKEAENKFNEDFLFCDTDPLSIKVWSLYKYGNSSEFIHHEVESSRYDLHLLLKPDLDYEDDPLREDSPLKNRQELFALFEKELINYRFKYLVIGGIGKKRTKNAISVIQEQFSL